MKCIECRNFSGGICDPPCLIRSAPVKIYDPRLEIECVLYEPKVKKMDLNLKTEPDELNRFDEFPHFDVTDLGIVKANRCAEEIIIPKEIFVEAFNRFIGNTKSKE